MSIPYPLIGIHAIKSADAQSVYMQLNLGADGGDDDETFDTVELTIVPAQAGDDPQRQNDVARLFAAISTCADLHPDPAEDDDDAEFEDRIMFEGNVDPNAVDGFTSVYRGVADGDLPPPLPGSSGWITAENVHEYFDAEGNWIEGADEEGVSGELGEGAGRVRARDEANGHTPDDEAENKRPRTD